jgi:hypothetical protein
MRNQKAAGKQKLSILIEDSLRHGTVFNQLDVTSDFKKKENIQRLMDYEKVVYWLTKQDIPYTRKFNSII